MSSQAVKMLSLFAVGIALVAGVFVLGRVTAHARTARTHGYQHGRVDGYLAGLDDGTAQGRQEGRAAQATVGPERNEFDAGYAAGADDVFAGYDGGWGLDQPYVITLERGTGQITYRISSRDQVEPGVAYYLCPGGHALCRHRR